MSPSIVRGVPCAVLLLACSDAGPPRPDPTPAAELSASAAPASSVQVPPTPPPPPPTLAFVPVHADALARGVSLFQLEGGLLVAEAHRVGRVTKEGVEWVAATIPKENPAIGPNEIQWVGGSYPDAIDVTYRNGNGRAPMPSYMPLTGKGYATVFAPGGGAGWIAGVARVGETTLLAGYEWPAHRIIAVRGPKRKTTSTSATKAGCTAEEVPTPDHAPRAPAIVPYAIGATGSGRAITVGSLCEKRGAAAEIWDVAGETSTIVSLVPHLKDVGFQTEILGVAGDRAFIVDSSAKVALLLEGEKVTALPALPGAGLPGSRFQAFLSSDRVLHASDGSAIHRFEEGAWHLVAHLQWPTEVSELALDGGELWATVGGRLHRLQPAESLALVGECKTPFVHLYDVSWKSEPTYTFPTTRKALASYAKVGEVGMVDFVEGVRRLGLIVPSREVGEEVVAHVKATMKDENPRLLCYSPPKGARAVPIGK